MKRVEWIFTNSPASFQNIWQVLGYRVPRPGDVPQLR